MSKQAKQLMSLQQADGVGNGDDVDVSGWLDMPSNSRDVLVTLAAENTASGSVTVEVQDFNGKIIPYHVEAFAADGAKGVVIGNLSIRKVRARVSGYASGDFFAACHYND